MSEVFFKHGAVKRADFFNVELAELFQKLLNLGTVFADDAYVVAPCLVIPGHIHVQRAESAESIGGEYSARKLFIGYHNLGPVYERRHYEPERMAAELYYAAFTDKAGILYVKPEVLLYHYKGL